MADSGPSNGAEQPPNPQEFAFGGLRFGVSFRSVGATLRVDGQVDGRWKELLRFDDFVDTPHFHAPAEGDSVEFDRENGEPLEWYLTQVGDHLDHWLVTAGYADLVPEIDIDAVASNIGTIREAMHACVPEGFERVPGIGLQRSG
jgi:hypothetical protein